MVVVQGVEYGMEIVFIELTFHSFLLWLADKSSEERVKGMGEKVYFFKLTECGSFGGRSPVMQTAYCVSLFLWSAIFIWVRSFPGITFHSLSMFYLIRLTEFILNSFLMCTIKNFSSQSEQTKKLSREPTVCPSVLSFLFFIYKLWHQQKIPNPLRWLQTPRWPFGGSGLLEWDALAAFIQVDLLHI